jgi:hypothetical protein
VSIWTDGLPAWWAMAVAVAALLVGVWLGELHGRGVGRGQEREDRKARRAARQVRSWREPSALLAPRRTSTAAFLNPGRQSPETVSRENPMAWSSPRTGIWPVPEVAHEAWLAHTEQALDLANEDAAARRDLTDTGWTRRMAEDMDAFIARLLDEHPITEEL